MKKIKWVTLFLLTIGLFSFSVLDKVSAYNNLPFPETGRGIIAEDFDFYPRFYGKDMTHSYVYYLSNTTIYKDGHTVEIDLDGPIKQLYINGVESQKFGIDSDDFQPGAIYPITIIAIWDDGEISQANGIVATIY